MQPAASESAILHSATGLAAQLRQPEQHAASGFVTVLANRVLARQLPQSEQTAALKHAILPPATELTAQLRQLTQPAAAAHVMLYEIREPAS